MDRHSHSPSRPSFRELPKESLDALVKSAITLVREATALELTVGRRRMVGPGGLFTRLIVTVPTEATGAQWSEADYWLREVGLDYEYASPPPWRTD